jgi:NRAMP (natural resistance-associated macrophage protein)-like metal ion transporter
MLQKIKRIFSILGPGFITGAADDDPSGIATYSQTGAQFGFTQLWTAPFSFPLMTSIQEMCGRIGIVTGKGLTTLIKEYFPKPILYLSVFLLALANTFNVGADLGAMAEAITLIVPIPFYIVLIFVAATTLALEIFIPYATYAKYLKYLALALFSYIATAFFVSMDWKAVIISTLVPHITLSKDYVMNLTALFGTTISPYLFFWQTSQEVEEMALRTKLSTNEQLHDLKIDTIFGMFFSNLIMWFIIAITGATLCKQGICSINTAQEAALALRPFAGDFAFLLFALGIIGTGLLAVPVLAGSVAYAVSEMMGWPCSLAFTYGDGKKFYHILSAVIIVGTFVNFLPINSITLLYYSAILNGLISPVLIFIILAIAKNKTIMGDYSNNRYNQALGIITGVIMTLIAVALIVSWFF